MSKHLSKSVKCSNCNSFHTVTYTKEHPEVYWKCVKCGTHNKKKMMSEGAAATPLLGNTSINISTPKFPSPDKVLKVFKTKNLDKLHMKNFTTKRLVDDDNLYQALSEWNLKWSSLDRNTQKSLMEDMKNISSVKEDTVRLVTKKLIDNITSGNTNKQAIDSLKKSPIIKLMKDIQIKELIDSSREYIAIAKF